MLRTAGLILAGGRSTRMGVDKALMDLAGRPVIARVIERFGPQVDALAINANGEASRFAAFHLPVLPDAPMRHAGPLAGVAAGLRFAQAAGAAWLATAPCDAPFLPRDLVARLFARRNDAKVALARGARGLEPLFGLWSVATLPAVETALREKRFAVHEVAVAIGAAIAAIPVEPEQADWALNLNRPEDHEAAVAMIARNAL